MPGKAFHDHLCKALCPKHSLHMLSAPLAVPGSSVVCAHLGPGESHIPGACSHAGLSVLWDTSLFKTGGGVVIVFLMVREL